MTKNIITELSTYLGIDQEQLEKFFSKNPELYESLTTKNDSSSVLKILENQKELLHTLKSIRNN